MIFRSIGDCFALDLRSLSVFRMLLALTLIYDLLVQKLPHVRMLYTEQGVMPSTGLTRIYGNSVKLTTLHYWTDDFVLSQVLMLVIGLLAAVSLLVGFRTWIALFVSWLLFVSLNRRLPLSGSGADTTLRIFMFWCLWIPLGHRFSIDNWLQPKRVANRHLSMATVGFILQLCFIYWFTAIYKLHPDWYDGSAVGHALRLDFVVTRFGGWLEQFDGLTSLLTHATLLAEILVPFLLFLPVFTAPARWMAIVVMLSFHTGIAFCMNLGFYPAVMLAAWIALVPTVGWEKSARWLGREKVDSADSLTYGKLHSWSATALLAFVAAYNVLGLDHLGAYGVGIPNSMRFVARALRVDQRWGMFAPTPNIPDGWFILPAQLANGTSADVSTGLKTTVQKPKDVNAWIPGYRVQHYMTYLRSRPNTAHWKWLAVYFSREWNRTHATDEAVRQMQIVWLHELTHNGEVQPVLMFEHVAESNRAEDLSANGALPTNR